MTRRCYSELSKLKSFEDRLKYLRLNGVVAHSTFGGHRYLNQMLYKSDEWKRVRRQVILRDNGLDLGVEGWPIAGQILVHHIEPIRIEDLLDRNPAVLDPDNLITVSLETHNEIHYGDDSKWPPLVTERRQFDTIPWRSQ